MATESSSPGDGGPAYPALIPRQAAGNLADELRLLWRALLLVSGDPAMAEAALVATIEAGRPWSGRPDRLTIWCSGFQALETEEKRTDVHLLGTPDNGPRASDIKAITNYLDATTPARRRILVGHHIGDLSTEDLQRFVAEGRDGEHYDLDQLVDWVEHDSRAAAKVLLIKPQHWIDVLSLLQPPIRPERLLRADSRPWRSGATVGGLAVVVLLFLALFSVNRASPPVADDADSAFPVTGDSDGDTSEGVGADRTDAEAGCPAVDLASRVLTSPVYQAGLQGRSFPEVLERSDLVVRGAVASIELEGGGIRFELDDQRVLFGHAPAPSSFFLNARFDATGDPVPNGVLFPDAVVFLKQAGDRWEVAEAGGFWADCQQDTATTIGANWPTGSLWPDQPTPSELAKVIDETLQDNTEFVMVQDGQRTVGGFRAFDDRIVVLQLPSGMQPAGEMSALIYPLPDVLALVGGPDLRLVLREQECDPIEQTRLPLAVCSSDGMVTIEIASPVELSDAWLERIDVFTVADEGPRHSGLVIQGTRAGEIVAIDPAVPGIVWRTTLGAGESLAAIGQSEVAFVGEELVLVSHWVDSRVRFLFGLASVDGQLLWMAEPEVVADRSTATLMVDQEREFVATLNEEGILRLVELADGLVRWSTATANATSINGISSSTLAVDGSSGELITVSLADGVIVRS